MTDSSFKRKTAACLWTEVERRKVKWTKVLDFEWLCCRSQRCSALACQRVFMLETFQNRGAWFSVSAVRQVCLPVPPFPLSMSLSFCVCCTRTRGAHFLIDRSFSISDRGNRASAHFWDDPGGFDPTLQSYRHAVCLPSFIHLMCLVSVLVACLRRCLQTGRFLISSCCAEGSCFPSAGCSFLSIPGWAAFAPICHQRQITKLEAKATLFLWLDRCHA